MKRTSTTFILLTILVLCLYGTLIYEPSRAQTSAPQQTPPDVGLKQIPKLVKDAKATGAVFTPRQLIATKSRLFQPGNQLVQNERQLANVVDNGVVFDLNPSAISNLLANDVNYVTLSLPTSRGETIELELVKTNILAPGFSVKTAMRTSEHLDGDWGVHYRGIVKDDEHSLAAISIFKNEIAGFFSTAADGNSVVGRLSGDNPSNTHIVYAEKDLKVEGGFSCETPDVGTTPLPNALLQAPQELPGQCIRIYVEADFDLFQNKGSVTNTANYITALFNQSATLYANDGISISLSEMFVWNAQSPYAGINDSGDLLTKFQQLRTSFNGDFGHLLALRGGGGVAATINGFCSTADLRECFSRIDPTFANVPTYTWSVAVFTHELGHLFGSFHTHACVWNGNETAIDGCGPAAGFIEGICNAGSIPASGGTIMSHCHLPPNPGINFLNGFGPQPTNLILNRLNGAACLTGCGPFTIGQDAPNPQLFINAANRNNFLQFAQQPPVNAVHRWNCINCDPANPTWGKGLIQDFNDVTPGVHDALMLADTNTNFVAQLYGGMWEKFIQLGGVEYNSANTRMIGYPVADRNCSDFNQSCSTDAQLVSTFGTSYHYQRFQGGMFVLHRSGSRNGQTFEVHGPIRDRWLALQGPTGSYGLPISDEVAADGNKRRSSFEGGAICYNPATNQTEDNCTVAPVIQVSVGTIPTFGLIGSIVFSVDGVTFGSSQTFTWAAGSTHTISTTAIQDESSGHRFSWFSWSDGGALSHTVSPTTNTNYTANFKRQAFLTLNAEPGGAVTPSDWFNTGESISISATPAAGFSFAGWVGSGTGAYTGGNNPATITMNNPFNELARFTDGQLAVYDAALKAPKCAQPGHGCDSGALLNGRRTITNGNEPNQPNTINNSCPDGTAGRMHIEESLDNIRVSTLDGSNFAPGKTVRIDVGVWNVRTTQDFLDLYYAADATNPNWVYITTLQSPTFGSQVLSTTYTLPDGDGLQAVRGRFRVNGVQAPCGSGPFDDHDDLIFTVEPRTNVALPANGGVATASSTFSNQYPASNTINGERAGANSTTGGVFNGWIGNSPTMPQWVQVDFGQVRNIQEIDVFTVQDNFQNPSSPTQAMTFSLYGLQGYDVQYWNGSSWVTITGGHVTGNDKVWKRFTFPTIATSKIRVLTGASPDSYSRITEIEAWSDLSTPPPSGINVALPTNGGVASASSTFSNQYPASNAINGERAGANSTTGGVFNGWIGSTATMPQWVQVDFGQPRNIQEIDVFTVQDNYPNPVPPTQALTFTLYGLQGFEVQYWNGSSWVAIPGGNVTGNNKVWKQFTFPTISTSKIRVLSSASPDSYSRVTEIEAWSDLSPPPPPAGTNVALASNGGIASASSTFSNQYPASNAINGERAGGNSTTGGVFNGWIGSTATMPQWLEINFGQTRNIQEIDVFTVQDNYPNPASPTQEMTFTLYGLQGFDVQYWNGSSWVTIPGGGVIGNNKIWKQFTFSTIATSKIRVLTSASPDSYSRVTEVEAWSTGP